MGEWQEDSVASRRSSRELMLLFVAILRGVGDCGNPGPGPHRAVQRPSTQIQGGLIESID